jgi:SAM-dependent methyltransferase
VKELLKHIGRNQIQNSRVLEVGCGQGYLVSHLLNCGAKHVIGTEIEQNILNTIPSDAYQLYRDNGQTVEFRVENFENTPMNIEVDIITMFIGANPLVYRLLDLFVENPHVKIIAFMKPAYNKGEFNEKLEEIISTHPISSTAFKIHLSISGEQRSAIVMKKIPFVDLTNIISPVIDLTNDSDSPSNSPPKTKKKKIINKYNNRLGLTSKAISRLNFRKRRKTARK